VSIVTLAGACQSLNSHPSLDILPDLLLIDISDVKSKDFKLYVAVFLSIESVLL
jgi:hypothetical protein